MICLFACQERTITPVEYVNWIRSENNGLLVKKEMGDLTYSIQFKPLTYLALLEHGPQNITKSNITDLTKSYEGLEYYTLQIKGPDHVNDLLSANLPSPDDYAERLEYLSFDFQNDIFLARGIDTLRCQLFHFERNYGSMPKLDFMLGFEPDKENNSDRSILLVDRTYAKQVITLNISKNAIDQIPNLNL